MRVTETPQVKSESYYMYQNLLLQYNCFTMQCQLPLYNNMNQLYIYVYPLPLESPSHPSWIQSIQVITEHPTSHLFYTWQYVHIYRSIPIFIYIHTYIYIYIYQCYSFNPSHPLLPSQCPQAHLYICVSIPFLQTGSSVYQFSRLHIHALKICREDHHSVKHVHPHQGPPEPQEQAAKLLLVVNPGCLFIYSQGKKNVVS